MDGISVGFFKFSTTHGVLQRKSHLPITITHTIPL